jgi:PAS domain S-box-containing protein
MTEKSQKRDPGGSGTPGASLQTGRKTLVPGPSLRLLLVFFVLTAGIIAAGLTYYRNYQKRYRVEVERTLSAIADLKTDELVDWRSERLGDAAVFYKNSTFSGLVRQFFEGPNDLAARDQLRVWLSRVREAHQYDRIFLLDTQGLERLSAPDISEPGALHLKEDVPEVLRSGQVTFLDFHRDAPDRPIHLSILVPILYGGDPPRTLGILVLRIDPATYLYPFITRWPTASRTAETLVVRREGEEVVFLNELRFRKGTALALRIPLTSTKTPVVQAALGYEGIMDGIDYRGVPVVAAVRAVPKSPWLLVARMDAAEVYAPVQERLVAMILVVGALLLGAGASVGLVWRHQSSQFYRARYETSEALRAVFLRQEALLAAILDIIMEVDNNKVYTWANRAGLEFFGGDVIGKEAAFYFEGEQDTYQTVKPLFNGHEGVIYVESWQRRRDGEKRLLAWWCRVLKDENGRVTGALSSARDITEQKRAEEEVRQKAKELQNRTDELTRFTYAVSHDLKSPLVTIHTFLGYLEQDARKPNPEGLDKDLKYIRNASEKMSRLLDELLELSRIGRKVNPSVETPLQAIVQEALDLVAGRIAKRGAKVEVTKEPILLYGDRPRLVEIFQNLVDNAVKFMGDEPAPRVEIGVEKADEEIVLFVRDNGIGIDPQHQPKLFGLFEKLDPGTEGTGLGLAIVRRIVDVHSGRIWVESEGRGQGATFCFTLAKTSRGPR